MSGSFTIASPPRIQMPWSLFGPGPMGWPSWKLCAPEAQIVLAERNLEAAELQIQPVLISDAAEVHVQVADVVGEISDAHQVPLEGKAGVAKHRRVTEPDVAREIGVDEEARVVDLRRAVLEGAVALAVEIVDVRATGDAHPLRPGARAARGDGAWRFWL